MKVVALLDDSTLVGGVPSYPRSTEGILDLQVFDHATGTGRTFTKPHIGETCARAKSAASDRKLRHEDVRCIFAKQFEIGDGLRVVVAKSSRDLFAPNYFDGLAPATAALPVRNSNVGLAGLRVPGIHVTEADHGIILILIQLVQQNGPLGGVGPWSNQAADGVCCGTIGVEVGDKRPMPRVSHYDMSSSTFGSSGACPVNKTLAYHRSAFFFAQHEHSFGVVSNCGFCLAAALCVAAVSRNRSKQVQWIMGQSPTPPLP